MNNNQLGAELKWHCTGIWFRTLALAHQQGPAYFFSPWDRVCLCPRYGSCLCHFLELGQCKVWVELEDLNSAWDAGMPALQLPTERPRVLYAVRRQVLQSFHVSPRCWGFSPLLPSWEVGTRTQAMWWLGTADPPWEYERNLSAEKWTPPSTEMAHHTIQPSLNAFSLRLKVHLRSRGPVTWVVACVPSELPGPSVEGYK